MRDRASSPVGGEYGVLERCLMQPRLDLSKRIPTFGRIRRHGLSRSSYNRPESSLNPQTLGVPSHYERRDDRLIPARRRAEEIDNPDLPLHRIPEPAVIG